MTTEVKKPAVTKPANYSPTQEQAIITAVKGVNSFDTQKVAIEALAVTPLFAGKKNARQLLSKLMHLSKSKASDRPVYYSKVYVPKVAGTPIKKCAIIEEIAAIMGVEEEALSTLEGSTKAALMLVLSHLQTSAETIFNLQSEKSVSDSK